MPIENKTTKSKYVLPSQRLLNIFDEQKKAKHEMTPYEVNLMVSLAILDKLEEVCLVLRTFMPRPAPAKTEGKKS